MTKLHECPEEPRFVYKDKCPITTCQYSTTCTSTGCLARDRVESSTKSISDLELFHYKCKGHKELGTLNEKQVGALRRKHVSGIRNIISLYTFVRYIEEHYTEAEGLKYIEGLSKNIDGALSSFPLNDDIIGFKPWMLPFLLDEELFREFIDTDRKTLPADLNLKNMLCTTPVKFKAIENDVAFMSNPQNAKRIKKALDIRKP